MKKIISLFVALLLCLGFCTQAAAEAAPEPAVVLPDFFANDEINRLVDENHERILTEGYAELRIPASLHGIPETAMSADSWEVGRKLLDAGYSAYVIGGCVRDFIMGKECNDIDLATDATLEQQMELFGDRLGTHASGDRIFGYVKFDTENVDLATFQNVPAAFAGLPGVPEFDPTSLTSDSTLFDSFQRDLTMNAIYYDMSNGDLVDYHGGIYDIREGVLSTMVDAFTTLSDDPGITLRAIRFKARYGFRFTDDLEQAIRENGREYIKHIDLYLCYNNTARMLVAGYSAQAMAELLEYGLLDALFPPLADYVKDPDYLAYLDKAFPWLDRLQAQVGEEIHKYLVLLAILQPVIDDRAESMDYSEALTSVLDEQEVRFNLYKVRSKMEEASTLCHQMKDTSSRFLQETLRGSWRYDGAQSLLNLCALRDESLLKQAEWWNQQAPLIEELKSGAPTPEERMEEEEGEVDEDIAA